MPTTRGILLVLVADRHDRWPTTELYRRHFLGVLHLVSGKECARAAPGVLCLRVNSAPNYIYHDTVAKVCVALARARAASREAHDATTQGRRLASSRASPPQHASHAWVRTTCRNGVLSLRPAGLFQRQLSGGLFQRQLAPQAARSFGLPRPVNRWHHAQVRTLREAVGDGRLRLATGVLVSHMDFWLRPPSFGRGLRRDMPWRLPRGLMPKHQPSAIRLLRPLNVTLATGSLAAGAATAGAAAAEGAAGGAAGAMAAAGAAGGVVAAPGATLARGAVVRFSSMTGLSFQRYAVSSEQQTVSRGLAPL